MKEQKTLTEQFGYTCWILTVLAINILMSGFVFMKLWAWLVSPIFIIEKFSFIHSVAIMMVIGYLRGQRTSKKEIDITESLIKSISVNALYLFFAWIVSLML